MSDFNPLGNFVPSAPVDPKILAKAKALYAQLPVVLARGITRAYYHWTVGSLGACFADYDAEALYANGDWALNTTNDPSNNVPGLNDNPEASHTYERNTGAVGIAITGMDGATPQDFGPDGVTVAGLTHLCAAGAAFALRYDLDVSGIVTVGPFAGEPTFFTHAEAADHGGNPQVYAPYGPATTWERWDLLSFVPIPAGNPFNDSSVCGNALRVLTHAYKLQMLDDTTAPLK